MLNFIKNLNLCINKKHKLVFFSENKNYQKYLIDFINQLNSNNFEIIYLSSDDEDKLLLSNVTNICIGTGFKRFFFLSLIKCNYFFMTLTDLGNHEIKKNKNIDNYVYIFHAANSVHRAYTVSAFDNYDIILCPGPRYENELKKLEKINNLKKKEIIKSGYFYLDKLREFKNRKDSNSKNVLIAPSWNYNKDNFFVIYSDKLIEKLINLNYNVIFRPHPEHFLRNNLFLTELNKKFGNVNNFTIDKNKENLQSMLESSYLITDYSGIAMEYILGLKKPVIYFDKYPKIHNINYKILQENPLEDDVKNKFGFSIENPEMDKIEDYLKNSQEKLFSNFENIEEFIKENFYNVDNSVKYTVKLFGNFLEN